MVLASKGSLQAMARQMIAERNAKLGRKPVYVKKGEPLPGGEKIPSQTGHLNQQNTSSTPRSVTLAKPSKAGQRRTSDNKAPTSKTQAQGNPVSFGKRRQEPSILQKLPSWIRPLNKRHIVSVSKPGKQTSAQPAKGSARSQQPPRSTGTTESNGIAETAF